MKFSKILTTAMMSAALVASSSALASETTWWTMDFDGLTIAEDGSLTNTLNNAYGTSENGWWTTEEGDQSTIEDGQLKLNTQGTDLTWTPNADNDTTAITYIDADVTFVGSDAAPTVTETDIHTAVYLKNLVDDTTSEVTNSVLCAWARPGFGQSPEWMELSGVTIKEGETYSLRIMLDGIDLSFFIDDTLLTVASTGATELLTAKDGSSGAVESVSFRGTGFVDNFAASQEAAAVIETARIIGAKVFLDNSDVTSEWTWMHYLNAQYNGNDLSLNGDSNLTTTAWNAAADPTSGAEIAKIAAIKLVSDTQSFEIVYDAESGEFSTDSTLSVVAVADLYGTMYQVYVDTDELVADAEYTLEFYYGEYTASEPEPEPEPVKLAVPVVSSSVTDTTVTLTWVAVENAVSYDVTFGDTTTTVTELTFTASDLTAETTYTFAVVANGDDENYVDSDAATVEVTTAAAAEPEPEFAPVAVTGITVDGDTVTLAIDGEYTEIQVYFSETVDGTFTPIESTFEDGVATVTSTTATGFFKVEAK
ncbi:MAG: hypothetical protein J6V41_02780 [Kiritimatiellae bacterium]|nr:hypothetical protein [Kiritimatiellia bacterium]